VFSEGSDANGQGYPEPLEFRKPCASSQDPRLVLWPVNTAGHSILVAASNTVVPSSTPAAQVSRWREKGEVRHGLG
jgi:hypothetical protein